jgi:phosphotransferase system IIA component
MTLEMKDFKFKYEEIKEQYATVKAGDQIIKQDLEYAETQFNSMRDKFLRLQRDKVMAEQNWQNEKEELLTII